MEEFRGEDAQLERLRDAIRFLFERHIKSVRLAGWVKPEADRLGWPAITRQEIDKFRIWPEEGGVRRPQVQKIYALWNVVFDPRFGLPTAESSGAVAPAESQPENAGQHEYFHASVLFFDIHQHRQKRARINLQGHFAFYHFSEYFHKFSDAIPRAVVVGQWDIKLSGGAYCVKEKQEYDGRLGKTPMRDFYTGYCLPKGVNICLIMRQDEEETPKFYVLESIFKDPITKQTMTIAGYMLKGSPMLGFYRSAVYAVRVTDGEDVECNIVRCEKVPPHILHELEALERK